MTSNCVVFKKNELYPPINVIGKLSSDFGLLSKIEFNLEVLCLKIKKCILNLMKNFTL